jgi:hypothetical protein
MVSEMPMRIVPLTLPVLGSAAIAARGQALRRVSPVAARCCPASAKSRSPGRVEKPAQDLRPRFALLLYEDAGFRPGSHTELVAEYAAWADSLRGQGKLVMGAELDQAETVVLSGAGNAAPASPGEERSAIGILGGFFIVRVATREEALTLARQCPHLRHGGRVVLRRLANS